MSKKSQITLFIIFSLIVIVVSIFLLYIFDVDLFTTKQAEITQIINDKISRCVEPQIINLASYLGIMGGTIEIPKHIENHPDIFNERYIDLGVKVLNWDYDDKNIPTIQTMENQISRSLLNNSLGCIEEELKGLDYIEFQIGEGFNIETFINDFSILSKVNLPITFNEVNTEDSYFIEDFNVEVEEIPLGAMYDLSVKIYNENKLSYFLESLIVDQILSAADYDSHNSFPTEGMVFSCQKKIWTKQNLKKNLARMNNANFKFLQIENTLPKSETMLNELGEDFKNYYENFYKIDVGAEKKHSGFFVDVFMPSVEITSNSGIVKSYPYRKFEISPSSSEIVSAKDFKVKDLGSISIPCIQIFSHKYDLDYDLVVKITDTSQRYNGFFFNFPIRVQIEDTYPKKRVPRLISENLEPSTMDNYCLEENRVNEVEIFAIDENDNYLKGASFDYSCILKSCSIENKTQRQLFNNVVLINSNPSLVTKLPYCVGGKLTGEKEGFFSKPHRVDLTNSVENEDSQIVEVKFYELKDYTLKQNDFLLVKSDGSSVYKDDIEIFVDVKNENLGYSSSAVLQTEFIELNKVSFLRTPQKYNISVYVMEDENLIGFLDIDNKLIDVTKGNRIKVKMKIIESGLEDEKYLEYYEEMRDKINKEVYYFKIDN